MPVSLCKDAKPFGMSARYSERAAVVVDRAARVTAMENIYKVPREVSMMER